MTFLTALFFCTRSVNSLLDSGFECHLRVSAKSPYCCVRLIVCVSVWNGVGMWYREDGWVPSRSFVVVKIYLKE